ncbi:elicitor-responsive protein 1 isoform X2 [Oryza brachyantha]|uniref:elicitor-responsive protein 1 isoform X2 n=1 Tax=Oryza brachyantha TaxID=4533 RepID=UPI0007766A8E|nr:elicitor-responsive protein 1 isoform X2 [Oryza brachyantha]
MAGSGVLEVHLVDAKGLAGNDFLGKIDPYVVVQYRSQERKSSVARDQGKNPSWNEVFKFQINSTAATGQHKLFLRLMDRDTFSRDDLLGEATIDVTDLISLGMEHGTWQMSESKHRVVLADKTYHGEIRVGLTFTAAAKPQDHGKQVGGWAHSFRQ